MNCDHKLKLRCSISSNPEELFPLCSKKKKKSGSRNNLGGYLPSLVLPNSHQIFFVIYSLWNIWWTYIVDYWPVLTMLALRSGKRERSEDSAFTQTWKLPACFPARLMQCSVLIPLPLGQPDFMYKSSSSPGKRDRNSRMTHCLMNKALSVLWLPF